MRIMVITCLLLGSIFSCPAVQAAEKMFVHDVYFTLNDNSDEAKRALVAGCKEYLAEHPGIVSFSAGVRVEESKREVNDQDFDVALHITFKDKASHDKYQQAESHHRFIEEFKDNWKTVRVFDSFAEPAREKESPAAEEFKLHPIGRVKKTDGRTTIVLDKKVEPGLLGLKDYSHAYVFWWFSNNDTPQKRSVLQVRPMGMRENPITGVFATRSPFRPNLIALTLVKIVAVEGNTIELEKIDAFDGTPVLDIKPFIPGYDSAEDAKLPEWLIKARERREKKSVPGSE